MNKDEKMKGDERRREEMRGEEMRDEGDGGEREMGGDGRKRERNFTLPLTLTLPYLTLEESYTYYT